MVSEENQLDAQIDAAFAVGNNQKGLALLRNLAISRSKDADLFYRLAVIEEQIGLPENTRQAYARCLQYAPRNPLAYLYAGYWLQQQGCSDEAVSLYSLGADIDETILTRWLHPAQSEETRLRSEAADKLLRRFLSDMHRESVGESEGNLRVSNAIWTRTHDMPFDFAEAMQKPQLFYIPALTASPYLPLNKQGPWVERLEASAKMIKHELLSTLSQAREQSRPYLPAGAKLDEAFRPLAGSFGWTALDIYQDGELNREMAQFVPLTLSALTDADVPLYCLDDKPYEVFFSLLKPGQHIKPHHGLSNHSLTVHLPVVVPNDCWLRVGEKHIWREGKLVVFDDTFEHEAVNGSEEERVVLIFSIWHPDLSLEERRAVRRSFKVRRNWRGRRNLDLQTFLQA